MVKHRDRSDVVLKKTPLKVRLRISLVEFTVVTGYFISSCVFEWKRYKSGILDHTANTGKVQSY